MYQRQIISRGFFVASRDRTKTFEIMEKDFDEIAQSIKFPVETAQVFSGWVAADDRLEVAFFDGIDNSVCIETGVADERFSLGVIQQALGHCGFVLLARG